MSTMAMLAGSRGPYTRADLKLLPDDGHRYEIIDGILIVRAAPGHTEMQPDVLVGRREEHTERDIAAPVLVVEVLSPIATPVDTHLERAHFERAGVPSHWVVDPVARPAEASLAAWEMAENGRYRQLAKFVGGERLEATRPYPVTVVPVDLVV